MRRPILAALPLLAAAALPLGAQRATPVAARRAAADSTAQPAAAPVGVWFAVAPPPAPSLAARVVQGTLVALLDDDATPAGALVSAALPELLPRRAVDPPCLLPNSGTIRGLERTAETAVGEQARRAWEARMRLVCR